MAGWTRWRRRLSLLGGAVLVVAAALLVFSLTRMPFARWRARHDLERARGLIAGGRGDAGRTALTEALRRDPRLGEARAALGELELADGHLEGAFLQFQALSDLQPENPSGWEGLARVRVKAQQPEEAAAALDRVLELAADRVAARAQRAELRLELGRFRGAAVDAEAVLRVDPRNGRAWSILARSTARLEGNAAGAAVAERGLAQVPDDPALREALASLRVEAPPAPLPPVRLQRDAGDRAERWPGTLGALMREMVTTLQRKDWSQAEALAASARKDHPTTFLGPWLQALVELSRMQFATAEARLREALHVAPRSHRPITNLISLWTNREGPLATGDHLVSLAEADPGFQYPLPIAAHAYLEADQPARAEATARRGLDASSPSPVPFRDLADLFLELDRASDALAVCEQGLARFPDDAPLLLRQARGSGMLGDRERALANYERLLSRRPDDQDAAGELAALLVETRSDAASRRRALELVHALEWDGPLEPAVLGAMGRVYLSTGTDPRRAQQLLEVAVQGAPDDPGLHFRLATARRANGELVQAAAELRAALGPGRPFPEEAEARRMLRELGEEPPRPRQ